MTWHISSSAIQAFKACPTRFRIGYHEGIRPVEEADVLRIGTAWHKCHEIARKTTGDPLTAVVEYLNDTYEHIPDNKDAEDWATERAILAGAFVGHWGLYEDQGLEVIAAEHQFDLPLFHPDTGLPLPDVKCEGKIDLLVVIDGRLLVLDYKSTGSSVDSGSQLWDNLRLDTQMSLYILSARYMQSAGAELIKFNDDGFELNLIPTELDKYPPVSGAFYDVWHKPGIRPRKAKKETIDEFQTRLIKDIGERPDFYFHRREITRTDAELHRFQWQLYHIYQSMRAMDKSGHWWYDESACSATYRCPFLSICPAYRDIDLSKTPPGFRRISRAKKP